LGEEGGGSLVAHLGLVLVGRRGRSKARRGSSAAPGAGHRGGGKFRRGGGEFGQRMAGEASTGSQGGVGVAGRRQKEGEGAAHRVAPMAAGGGKEQWGGSVRRERSSGRLPFYGLHARASYRGSPRLTRRTARPQLAHVRSPAADRWANLSAKGGEGKGSTWRGTDFRDPRSAPNLGRSGLGMARGRS
jgi:hypothetical protein